LITPPDDAVLTLAEVRDHCRVDDGDTSPNTRLAALIAAATAYLDGGAGVLGRALLPQTWEWYGRTWPRQLPLPPTIEVLSVKYLDMAGEEQTLAADQYRVIYGTTAAGATLWPAIGATWPDTDLAPDAVRVRFTAGYEPTDASPPVSMVPLAVRQAMLLMVGHWYENRSEVVVGTSAVPLPLGVAELLAPYRLNWIA
jgi:uncharacterized phiE125 gp8 family phage protein